ncbi:MAG: Succinate--CoA ligase [ADP-forming] subunit beta [Myxococcota bacterium]|nr:Succinate--CoA ligase [ADP-forming] subunit beta [Myxococcota bacterium]
MKIHEYQAKELLKKVGVAVPNGIVANTPDEARNAARQIGGKVVVKAQVHAGGRGKGGGVKLANNEDEAFAHAGKIIGMQLITYQTRPGGQKVKKVLVEAASNIVKEYYAGLTLDRETSLVTLMASTEGGMDIEEVAKNHPEKIHREAISPLTGLNAFQARSLVYKLGIPAASHARAVKFFQALYRAYVETDASLLEVNPMILTAEGDIFALDGKMNFDDNALFRHPDIADMRDLDEEDAKEVEASHHDLSYISLDGAIGCMVNGAGLAMATMDVIKLYNAEPANFLDVGGSADQARVTAAFKIILSDPRVKGILVNIFAGIAKCDVIAAGIVAAAREVSLNVPLVVRLQGTNKELGKKILADSGLTIIAAETLSEAAEKITAAVRK